MFFVDQAVREAIEMVDQGENKTMEIFDNCSKKSFIDLGYEENIKNVHEIFQMYEARGFLYPQKKQMLGDHLSFIEKNWSRAIDQRLINIIAFKGQDNSFDASVVEWRTVGGGWLYQHLVANQNPWASYCVMRGTCFESEFEKRSKQNWFRPNNKYANKLFGSAVDTIGGDRSVVISYAYLKAKRIILNYEAVSCVTVHGVDANRAGEFRAFVVSQRGMVFAMAEEITETDEDWELSRVNVDYENAGLFRRRHIVLAVDKRRDCIVGVGLVYRGPLGLNFSFIENRLDLIVDFNLDKEMRVDVARALLDASFQYYSDFELDWIPLVVDNASIDDFGHGVDYLRDYKQLIWLQSGFNLFGAHLDKFYKKIITRWESKREFGNV
ncbi:putative N-acetyltransferase domain-containing protein [Azospirillaceae bacterium]